MSDHRDENCKWTDVPCCWPGGSLEIVRICVPLEIVGRAVDGQVTWRRYPHAENRVFGRPGRPRGAAPWRGSKERAASTCEPHSDSFNDTSRCRCSNCSTNNFQTPYRSKS
ncbi:hypothetical protein TNCV_1269991 [Trichonephila clavipes]|nr:hypothetical protein TNCV_1269991 [Trichonephila clavipes]